jgi:hypothetical protein
MSNEIVLSQWFDAKKDSPVNHGIYQVERQNGEIVMMEFCLYWQIPVAFIKSWRGVVRSE